MGHLNLFVVLVGLFIGIEGNFQIGLGRYDVTGPSVEVPFVSRRFVNFDCDLLNENIQPTDGIR